MREFFSQIRSLEVLSNAITAAKIMEELELEAVDDSLCSHC